MEDLKQGRILGNFKILELISSGGMGAVYKACHKNNPGEIFALKVIRSEFCSDKGFVSRFRQEEGLIINLSHPNIVKGFHFGVSPEGEHYFVMEYVEGEDLRARLVREKRLSIENTLHIAIQMCSALEYAHGEGVIHRDIKPENILLKPDGAALLADFGIMKMVGEGTYHKTVTSLSRMNSGGGDSMEGRASFGRLSSAGGSEEGRQSSDGGAARKGPSPGTLSYMAPEQISGGVITARTDIYQLGAVMYECLTGELSLGRFEDPSTINPAITPDLENVILNCLKKSAKRYESASVLHHALTGLPEAQKTTISPFPGAPAQVPAQEQKTAELPKGPAPIEQKEKPRIISGRPKRNWPVMLLLIAPLILIALLIAWSLINDRGTAGPDMSRNANKTQTKTFDSGKNRSDSVPFSTRQQQQGSSLDLLAKANKSASAKISPNEEISFTPAERAYSGTKKQSADAKAGQKAAETRAASNCNKGNCAWDDAVAYCKGRRSRLPTVHELQKMGRDECTGVKRPFTCMDFYWSSEMASTVYAWTVFLNNGDVRDRPRANTCSVRCARRP